MSNSAKKVPGGNDKERLQSVFDYFDADGNGSIDVNELRQIIRGLGNNPTEDELNQIISDVDNNGDGVISFAEFESLMTHDGSALAHGSGTDENEILESFKIFDLDRNGLIAVDDFRKIMAELGDKLPPAEIEEMIRMCDTDGDGKIQYENFVHMVQNAPQNLGLLDL